jgi:phosphopantetheinyl transferase (holo-ACP synthase)
VGGVTGNQALPLAIGAVADAPPPTDPIWRDWLTAAELAYSRSLERVAEHLVVRLLAKRAVIAALGWPGDVPWHAVEIRRQPPGPPWVELTGPLDAWRRERRLPVPGVSLTHAAGHAAALAWLPGRPARAA